MNTLSVITVCLNAADHIEASIRSVQEQTYPQIEHLVIDGGSTDGTLEIIEPYRDGIDYFVSEPDSGLYNAMNKGIRAATGSILIFLNADDRFHDPGVVADAVQPFDEHPGTELVYGEILMDREGALDDRWRQLPVADRAGLCQTTISHQAQFARSSLFQTVGLFDEQYRAVADYDWLYRVVVEHRAATVHLDRLISIVGTEGITCATQAWKAERRAVHRKYYSLSERIRWRWIPRYIRPRIWRVRDKLYHGGIGCARLAQRVVRKGVALGNITHRRQP